MQHFVGDWPTPPTGPFRSIPLELPHLQLSLSPVTSAYSVHFAMACRSLARCARLRPSSRPSLLSLTPSRHTFIRTPSRSSRTYATESVFAADLKFGQPLHETHPHLLDPGERTCIDLLFWIFSDYTANDSTDTNKL